MRSYSLFIGIDISKNWIDASLTVDGKIKQMPHGRFDNTTTGFNALLKFIRQRKFYPGSLKQCAFCMEHTGIYPLPICRYLQNKKVFYVLVSPYHLKRSLGLLRSKSDQLDSAHISRYAYLGYPPNIVQSKNKKKVLKMKKKVNLETIFTRQK